MLDTYIILSNLIINNIRINNLVSRTLSVQNSLCEACRRVVFKTGKLPRAFYRKIGRKGGLAGAGSEAKRNAAILAANTRWMVKPVKNFSAPIVLQIRKDRVWISNRIQGLEKELTARPGTREKGESIVNYETYCFLAKDPNGALNSPLTLLDRIKRFLQSKNISYRVRGIGDLPKIEGKFPPDIREREVRHVKKLLKPPYGGISMLGHKSRTPSAMALPPRPRLTGLSRKQGEKLMAKWEEDCNRYLNQDSEDQIDCPQQAQEMRIVISLVKSFQRKTLVITRGSQFAKRLFWKLKRAGVNNLGLVAGNNCEDGDVVITTAAAFDTGNLPFSERDLVIMCDIPIKGLKEILKIWGEFPVAIKYGITGNDKRRKSNQLVAELVFGPFIKIDT